MSFTTHFDPSAPPLRFSCGNCGRALEAPAYCAGVEAPCPLCRAPVRAPVPAPPDPAELVLDAAFWDDPSPSPRPQAGARAGTGETAPVPPFPPLPESWFQPPPVVFPDLPPVSPPAAEKPALPAPAAAPAPVPTAFATLFPPAAQAGPPAYPPLNAPEPIRFPSRQRPASGAVPAPASASVPASVPVSLSAPTQPVPAAAVPETPRTVLPPPRNTGLFQGTPTLPPKAPEEEPRNDRESEAESKDEDQEDDDDGADAPPTEGRRRRAGNPEMGARARRRARNRLRLFDAGLLLLFFGVAAMAGAAIIFKDNKDTSHPPEKPPTLTAAHFELMKDVEERRRQSQEDARQTIQLMLSAPDGESAAQFMLPGADQTRGLPFPVFPGKEAKDFEFVNSERLPGTERFLSSFELAGNPPVMLMVEETSAGSRIHGAALDQQMNRRLENLLAKAGEGEGMFYLRLRPTPERQAADFDIRRPDLTTWVKVDAESAFPIDGPTAFIACIAPGSPALDVLERRLHDPAFRPAVVRLAWRRHRESGPFLELVEFVPNGWSRH